MRRVAGVGILATTTLWLCSSSALEAVATMQASSAGSPAGVIRQQAETGDAAAQYELAYRYATGDGVAQDLAQALQWFQRSAAQNYHPAFYALGVMYRDGAGVAGDPVRAAQYFRKGMELGNPQAMASLGVLYGLGQGVQRDLKEAFKWLSLSVPFLAGAEQAEAIARRDEAKSLLTAEQIAQAGREGEEWYNSFRAKTAAAAPPSAALVYTFDEHRFTLQLPSGFSLITQGSPQTGYKRFDFATEPRADGTRGVIQVGLFDSVKMGGRATLEEFTSAMVQTMRDSHLDWKATTSTIDMMGAPAQRVEWSAAVEASPGQRVRLKGVMILGVRDAVGFRLEAQGAATTASEDLAAWERALNTFALTVSR